MYLQYPEGSTERSTIEKRHGKADVLKLVAKFREEQLNRKWIEKETMTYGRLLCIVLSQFI
jgi:E3 ubiquitin-protein ligase RNF14